ncbi:phage minor tail protein L [Enterobacter huaxiensis]|uniref:phage minor tail protein L n=1 Tax=Enterobacter huaxiensis TaxID=2494702 RepID=UPI002175B127|nr:phage minor tail protein L [Enterobacter huaxiensis]MCS5452492.1 phage minor tail protein L [Enterobacter huaxiensis]
MPLLNDLQKLEPGSKIRLIEIDGTKFDAMLHRFHANTIPHTEAEVNSAVSAGKDLAAKSIWFDGNEYSPFPYEINGMEASSDGSSAEPTLRVANLDGVITSLCLHFADYVGAQVTVIDTLNHYLDAKNFPAGNKTADPHQCYKQVWYIDSKVTETNEIVEFKLASPLDLQGLVIPTRQITGLCTWACRNQYRKAPCNYGGGMGWDLNDQPVGDPAKDKCAGLLSSCKLRFGANAELPFGGFPGSNLLRR